MGGSKASGWGSPACSPELTRGTTGLSKTTVTTASVCTERAPSAGMVWVTRSGPVAWKANSTAS